LVFQQRRAAEHDLAVPKGLASLDSKRDHGSSESRRCGGL
jgi:hypothetical protein